MIKIHSFIDIFHQLWKAGETAHLDLNTHAGQAWISLRTPLGHYGQPHQYPPQYPPYPPQTPTHHQYPPYSHTNRSPSYFHRQQRWKATKAANDTTTNTVNNSAEQVEYTVTPAEQAYHTITPAEQADHTVT